ncbi:MAG: pilus assembly protein [Firmicutes bacterium]|nr:pilus assembly protein [Bacillota bacterium]
MRAERVVADQRGAAAVEFVLVAGMLFTVLFGVLEFGLLMNSKVLITSAARECARRAAVDGGSSQAAVSRALDCLRTSNLDPGSVEVVIRPAQAAYGSQITVRVSCPYVPLTPLLRRVAGGRVTLDAEVVTRSERVR